MIFAAAGRRAFRQSFFSIRCLLTENRRNGSQDRHATEYRRRFCVHESICAVRYFIEIGPTDQQNSVPTHAKVAARLNLRLFIYFFPHLTFPYNIRRNTMSKNNQSKPTSVLRRPSSVFRPLFSDSRLALFGFVFPADRGVVHFHNLFASSSLR